MLTTSSPSCSLSPSSRQRRNPRYCKKRPRTRSRRRCAQGAVSAEIRSCAGISSLPARSYARQPDGDIGGHSRRPFLWRKVLLPSGAPWEAGGRSELWPALGRKTQPDSKAQMSTTAVPGRSCGLAGMHSCPWKGCTRQLRHKRALNLHLKGHLKGRRFACAWDACNRVFTTTYRLATHLKRNHRGAREHLQAAAAHPEVTQSCQAVARQGHMPSQPRALPGAPARHLMALQLAVPWYFNACMPVSTAFVTQCSHRPLGPLPYPYAVQLPVAWNFSRPVCAEEGSSGMSCGLLSAVATGSVKVQTAA